MISDHRLRLGAMGIEMSEKPDIEELKLLVVVLLLLSWKEKQALSKGSES